jgi:hypothetical protein
MCILPVVYYNPQNVWSIQIFITNWFHNHFAPKVRTHQKEVLKFSHGQIKALLILDNAPAHPDLSSKDGKIKCLALPPNTTALIQPVDQGIIMACRRLYRCKFLDEVMAVFEDRMDEDNNTRQRSTLENIK